MEETANKEDDLGIGKSVLKLGDISNRGKDTQ